MLRSIIAIWTIALALLAIAATSGCDLNGCDTANQDSCSVTTPMNPDFATHPDLAGACPQSCPTCASDESCFQGSITSGLPSFCARGCGTDLDCRAGEKCVTLFAAMQPPVCISPAHPTGCGGKSSGWICDLATTGCKDPSTAQVRYVDADSQVCGWEQVHCANGCANGACL